MNVLKNIVSIIWGIYGATILGFVLLFMLFTYKVVMFFTDENDDQALRFLLRFNTHFISKRVLFPLLLLRLKVHGKQHIKKRPYVIVSNHLSTLDIIVNGAAFPHTLRFLSKTENGNAPILGPVVRKACLLVDRTSRTSRIRSLKEMIKTLKQDRLSLMIYPEGTRNRTDDYLQPFFDGAFKVAIKTNTPILVQTIVGSGVLYPPNKAVYLLPGVIHAYWDQPIETKDLTAKDIPALKEQVRQIMINNLSKHEKQKWQLVAT